jgi:cell division protein FtsL
MAAARADSLTERRLPASDAPSADPGELSPRRPKLDVVDRRLRASRSVHRQANVLRALGVMFVVGALAVTAVAHTLVASDQQRIDTLQSQLAQSLTNQQNLQISRAELESPLRVLSIAEHQLHMVAPGSVSYLAPVNPGPSVEQSAKAAARQAVADLKTGIGSSRAGGRSSAISQPG